MDTSVLGFSLIILFYAVIQSVFGIGILAFGTPTFLLLGFPFQETLSILLPASLCVSFLQIWHEREELKLNWKRFSGLTFFFAALGLSITLYLLESRALDIKIPVGVLMIFSAFLRFSKTLSQKLKKFVGRYEYSFVSIIGFVHGMTNMGGGLLSAFASILYDTKAKIRSHVALGYFVMGLAQIFVLLYKKQFVLENLVWIAPIVSSLTFVLVGNRIFQMSKESLFHHALTGFLLVLGVSLFVF
jgi:hypothetical protein